MCRWIPALLVLQLGTHIFLEIWVHREHSKRKWRCWVKNILVGQPDVHTRNAFIYVHLIELQISRLPIHGLEAKWSDRPASGGVDLAISNKDLTDYRSSLLRLSLKKVEQVARSMLVKRDAILVLLVEFGDAILSHMLRQCDGRKSLEIIGVHRLEIRAKLFQKVLSLFSIAMTDELEI